VIKSRNVGLIFARELRDQLRDRRTMFMLLVLPILLYPAMVIGMLQMQSLFQEEARTIVILGNEDLPESPALLEGAHFAQRFFKEKPADARLLKLVLESPAANPNQPGGANGGDGLSDEERENLLNKARELAELTRRLLRLKVEEDVTEDDQKSHALVALEEEAATKFANFPADLVVAIPPGFDRFVEAYTTREHPPEGLKLTDNDWPLVVYSTANDRSRIAHRRMTEILWQYRGELMQLREQNLNLPPQYLDPLFERRIRDPDVINVEDVARTEQRSANNLSRFVPVLLILMTLTGAFYPAIDLGAGEKERGTMETLLISPAARSEIVLGKFFTIMLFAITMAICNIASMGLTGFFLVTFSSPSQVDRILDLSLPPVSSFVVMGVMMIPLAALFSALSLALATFAKSTKEGQYYLTPLMIVVMGLGVFCMSPGVELTPFNSVIPVVGLGLLIKSLILSSIIDVDVYVYLLPVLLTSIGYSMIGLWWAIEQFHREEVLFRESERFSFKQWLHHLLREKEELPTSGEAVFCFILIMVIQFFSIGTFQKLLTDPNVSRGDAVLMTLLITQIAVIASPALFMGILITSNIRRTLRLHWPRWKWLAMAIVLPLLLQPLAGTLQQMLSDWFFPDLPPGVKEALAPMSDPSIPLLKVIAIMALLPAICEELAFRGFILSGFARNGRTTVAIIFSALLFGVMHMIPQQVFNAFLLGLVLALLALRSGSLLPGVVFHFVNNAMGVLTQRFQDAFEAGSVSWLATVEGDELVFSWLTLIVCLIGGTLCIWHLGQSGNDVSPALAEKEIPETNGELPAE
jgi:sodium transport system permease protein